MSYVYLENITHHVDFNNVDNPLANSLWEHYAHTAMSTGNISKIYNYLIISNVNPMHRIEQHMEELSEAECAYGF
jgi:hypothetical protein